MAFHNPQLQMGENGPLKPAVRKRLDEVKNRLNLTLVQVGSRLGFSGPFVSALLKDSDPARVRTKHVDRIISVLEEMEIEAGIRPGAPAPMPRPDSKAKADISLNDLVHAAHKLGFEVSFKPLR